MKLKLKRIAKKETYTIGKLYIDGVYFCDTIEDADRGLNDSMELEEIMQKKIKGITAIPTGTYAIDMNMVSPKYKAKQTPYAKPYHFKLPRLLNVKGFDGILIHCGNTAEDSMGCILVGKNKIKGKVINSIYTFHQLMKILLNTKEKITITII